VPDDPAPFEALRGYIAQSPFAGDGVHLEVTCSIGVTWLRPQDHNGFDLIRRADAALYVAKTAGRNRVVLAGEHWETA
jgi:diguanylate cyclase (GGDEF)-like protein